MQISLSQKDTENLDQKLEKNESGVLSRGGGVNRHFGRLQKHFSCDKNISDFNRVEKKCVHVQKVWSPWTREPKTQV